MPAGHHLNLAQTGWRPATPGPVPPGQIHLWRIGLRGADPAAARRVLCPDELTRAERFHRAADHDRYVVTRAALRRILAASTPPRAPAALRFRYSPHGKPALAAAGGLSFNVSHDRDYALVALGRGVAPLGVDLERVDHSIPVADLVSRFFAPAEQRAVLNLPERQRHEAFFRTWTRKEAFIKAHGGGLSIPLDRFAVSVDFGAPASLSWVDWRGERAGCWQLWSFTVAEGLPGALALGGAAAEPTIGFYDY